MAKPPLLALMILASGAAVVANGVTLAAPLGIAPQSNRLGTAINQDLSARDSAAAQAARQMDLREAAAKAAEARLKSQLETQQGLPPQAAAPQPAAEEQFDGLARIYQAMKPAEAALVFEQLDMDVQMKVAQRMRDRATGMILAKMTPRGAAALTMALARKKANAAPLPPATAAKPTGGEPERLAAPSRTGVASGK